MRTLRRFVLGRSRLRAVSIRRARIRERRRIRGRLEKAEADLKVYEGYQPICIGGVEDRADGLLSIHARITVLSRMLAALDRKLGK